jgi:hypothetical protein
MSHDDVFTINFQANRQLHDDLHAVARSQERSASAVIRMAIRAWLKKRARRHSPCKKTISLKGKPRGSAPAGLWDV